MQFTPFFLLFLKSASTVIHVIDRQHSEVIIPTASVRTFPSTGEALYSSPDSDSYTLFTWAKLQAIPATGQLVAALTCGSSTLFQLKKGSTGQWTLAVTNTSGSTFALNAVGSTTPVWAHIAVFVCSDSLQATLAVTAWQGSTVWTSIPSQSPFLLYDPEVSALVLGGTVGAVMDVRYMQGQLLDTQFETGVCRPLSDVAATLGSTQCYSQCSGSCLGPGDKSCNDYIQLTDEMAMRSSNLDILTWSISDPVFLGHTFGSFDFSFTGWYFDTEIGRVWRNYFRNQNNPGNACTLPQQRVMTIFKNSDGHFYYYIETSTGCINIFSSPSVTINKWTFVTLSNCNGAFTYCFGYFTDTSLTCGTATVPGSTFAWGTSTASTVSIGDSYHGGGMVGRMGDQRYYFDSCYSATQFGNMFTGRKSYCGLGCSTCASPFECATCSSGYYPASPGKCVACNACCLTCSGPGNTACTSCSSDCQSLGPTTCASNFHAECYSKCLACTGARYWSCASCISGYSLQPHSSQLCLTTCPSGYSSAANICVGTDKVVMDYTFDQISQYVTGVMGQIAANGATFLYIEPSDPIPSKHRGYYFRGGQYLQLPPAADTSGFPLILPSTFTFIAWLRPQGTGQRTIYSKEVAGKSIFTLRLNSAHQLEISSSAVTLNHSVSLSVDLWIYIGIILDYSGSTGLTTVRFYYDGALHVATLSQRFHIEDDSSAAVQTIGASGSSSNFYSGFMWRVAIANYISIPLVSGILSQGCPSGLSFCLSPCPFLQTADCQYCDSACVNGCVRTTDCSYCADELCDACASFESASCNQCIPNAQSTSGCHCTSTYFLRSRECVSCSPECKECDSDTPYSCLECNYPATLSSRQCLCPGSYYPSSTGTCQPCAGVCLTCSSATVCQSCKPHSRLVGTNCECEEGYQALGTGCEPCEYGCAQCDAACSRCFSEFFLFSGICMNSCPEGFRKNTGTCIASTPLTATLSPASFTELLLAFSAELATNLTSQDFTLVAVESSGDSQACNLQLRSFLGTMEYIIRPDFSELLGPNLKVIVQFISTSIADRDGNLLSTSELTANMTLHVPSTSATESAPSPIGAAATQATVTTGVVSSMMSGSPTGLFTMLNNIQLLSYLPLSGVPLPKDLRALLISLNLQSFLPNPFLYWVEANAGPKPPEYARNYGYDSCVLAVNVGVSVLVGVSVFLWSVIAKLMRKFPVSKVALFFVAYNEKNQWSGIVRYWIQTYLDTVLASGLQIQRVFTIQLSFADFSLSVNSAIGIICALACVATPLGFLAVTLKYRSKAAEGTWKCLFEEFKNEKGSFSSLFYSMFLIRRLFYAAVLLSFSEWPKLQSATFFAHSLTVVPTQTLVYLLLYSPYKSALDQVSTVLAESCITVVFSLSIAFNYRLSSCTEKALTTVCTTCIYVTMAVSNVVAVISSLKLVKALFLAYKRARAEAASAVKSRIVSRNFIAKC